MSAGVLHIDVVCAWPDRVWMRRVTLPAGSTVEEALIASQARSLVPDLDGTIAVGIFGKVVPASQPLANGDRVELYRPLLADPKEARRRRAAGEVRP